MRAGGGGATNSISLANIISSVSVPCCLFPPLSFCFLSPSTVPSLIYWTYCRSLLFHRFSFPYSLPCLIRVISPALPHRSLLPWRLASASQGVGGWLLCLCEPTSVYSDNRDLESVPRLPCCIHGDFIKSILKTRLIGDQTPPWGFALTSTYLILQARAA